jgi:hypothetical protein
MGYWGVLGARRVAKGALAPCPPSAVRIAAADGGHAIALPTLRAMDKATIGASAELQIGIAVQELRQVMAQFARGRPLGRVAADLGFQLHQIGEDVGLAPQFVGNQRRLSRNRRNDGHPDPATLQRPDQGAEIAITGEQHDLVDMFGEFQGIDREFDIHVAPHLATAAGVDVFLGRLGDHGVAIVIEPVDQGPDRRIFLILDDRGVVNRAKQRAPALELLEQALVIDIETKRLAGRIEIGAIDQERDLAVGG